MVLEALSKGDSWQPGGMQLSLMPPSFQRSDSKPSKFDSVLSSNATLLLASSDNYKKSMASLIKLLAKDKNLPGIYVAISRSCKDVYSELGSLGLPRDKVLIIDMISESTGTQTVNAGTCVYLHSPQSLTDLAIAINEAVAAMNTTEMFIIIDSLSTLLLYNPPSTVMQFAHFITNKMRSWGGGNVKGVLVVLPNELDEKTISMLKQFVDNVVVVEE